MISGESCRMSLLSEQVSERCCSIRPSCKIPNSLSASVGPQVDNSKDGEWGWPNLES